MFSATPVKSVVITAPPDLAVLEYHSPAPDPASSSPIFSVFTMREVITLNKCATDLLLTSICLSAWMMFLARESR